MSKTTKSGADLQLGTETEVTAGINFKKALFTRAWGKSYDFQTMQGLFSEEKALVATSYAM